MKHLQVVDRFLQYLNTTPVRGLLFNRGGSLTIEANNVADCAGSVCDRSNVIKIVILLVKSYDSNSVVFFTLCLLILFFCSLPPLPQLRVVCFLPPFPLLNCLGPYQEKKSIVAKENERSCVCDGKWKINQE